MNTLRHREHSVSEWATRREKSYTYIKRAITCDQMANQTDCKGLRKSSEFERDCMWSVHFPLTYKQSKHSLYFLSVNREESRETVIKEAIKCALFLSWHHLPFALGLVYHPDISRAISLAAHEELAKFVDREWRETIKLAKQAHSVFHLCT